MRQALVYLQVTLWSMPERLECEVLQKARYINTLTFTFYISMQLCRKRCKRRPNLLLLTNMISHAPFRLVSKLPWTTVTRYRLCNRVRGVGTAHIVQCFPLKWACNACLIRVPVPWNVRAASLPCSLLATAETAVKAPIATTRRLYASQLPIRSFVNSSVSRQNAYTKTRFSQKLSNLELWSLMTTYRKSYVGFSKNPLLDPKNSRWWRYAILKIVKWPYFNEKSSDWWNWVHDCIFGTRWQPDDQIWKFSKFKMANGH